MVLEQSLEAPSIAGDAHFSGVISVVPWPRADLTRLLPEAVSTAGVEAGDVCPVIVLFGEQRHGASVRGGIPLPLERAFHEFGVIVPWVRIRGIDNDCSYVARMCSSYRAVVSVGNRHYGFHKTLVAVQRDGGMYSMSDEQGCLQFYAHSQQVGRFARLRAFDGPIVGAIQALTSRPVVGLRAEGVFVESRFDWDFSSALVCGASVDMVLDPALGLAAEMRRFVTAPGDAIQVESMSWGLSWPGLVSHS